MNIYIYIYVYTYIYICIYIYIYTYMASLFGVAGIYLKVILRSSCFNSIVEQTRGIVETSFRGHFGSSLCVWLPCAS